MYGIKASLTHIKDIADWPKDDDEELIAAILFHYGGSNVAQRMPAAEIFNRFAIKRPNDKYNHSDVLKLQAHTAQAIHEYPVSMAAVGVETQINLFVMNCWPLHFRHDLESRVKHLKEWGPVWDAFNPLTKEYDRSNQIEALRLQFTAQSVAAIALQSPQAVASPLKTPAPPQLEEKTPVANKVSTKTSTCPNCSDLARQKPHTSATCFRHCKDPDCQSTPHLHQACPKIFSPKATFACKRAPSHDDIELSKQVKPPAIVNAAYKRQIDNKPTDNDYDSNENVRYMFDRHGNAELVLLDDNDEIEDTYDYNDETEDTYDYDAAETKN